MFTQCPQHSNGHAWAVEKELSDCLCVQCECMNNMNDWLIKMTPGNGQEEKEAFDWTPMTYGK